MKRKLILGVVVLIGIAGAMVWFARSDTRQRLMNLIWPREEDPLPTVRIQKQDYTIAVSADGELTGLQTVPLSAPAVRRGSLKVAKVVEEGSIVAAGEVVVRFDSTDATLALEKNQNTVTSYNYQIDKSHSDQKTDTTVLGFDRQAADIEVDYADHQVRRDEDIFSRWEIQESIMSAALAKYRKGVLEKKGQFKSVLSGAEIDILNIDRGQAESEVQFAQETLSSLELKTPIAGVALYFRRWMNELKAGAEVWPGQPLLEIASLHQFQCRLNVVENEASGVVEGRPVRVRLTALPGLSLSGRIKKMARVADQITREDPRKYFTCDVLLDVPVDLLTKLKPGMQLQGVIEAGRRKAAMVAPKSAVIKKESRFVVFVKTGTIFVERPVTILDSDHGFYVLQGLQDGEEICLRHPYEKQELRLPDFSAPSAASQSRRFMVMFD